MVTHYYGNKYGLKSKFIESIRRIGIIAPAAREAGISRATANRWLREDTILYQQFELAMKDCIEKNRRLLQQVPEHKRHALLTRMMLDGQKISL